MEFMNVIRSLQGMGPIYNNSAKNTSISIIRFSKSFIKTKVGINEKIMPQVILENDNSHLYKE